MKIIKKKKPATVAIITPASGNPLVRQCIDSVDAQTYLCKHYLFYDGIVSPERFNTYNKIHSGPNRDCAYWPSRINSDGVHTEYLAARRIYAASPYLVNEDYICFLNEDDWFEPNHVESLLTLIEKNHLDWAHSLRSVYDKEGNYLFPDNCESLGKYEIWNAPGCYLVESCSYMVKTNVLCAVAGAHNHREFGPDRLLFAMLAKLYPKFDCTGLHTMCFRLGGNEGSVSKEFLEVGNATMAARYPEGFPWIK
jgi:hypothetical protein